MIVYQIKKNGPSAALSFTGPEAATPLSGITIYGKAWQTGTPTVANPVSIQYVGPTSVTLSATASGQTTQISIPVSVGLKGIKYYRRYYLVGNNAYLTTQNGDRLMVI